MEIDLILMTLFGAVYGTIILIITYKRHIHHWVFGIIALMGITPPAIIYFFFRKDYLLSLIIVGLVVGVISFLMDFDDFKTWIKKK